MFSAWQDPFEHVLVLQVVQSLSIDAFDDVMTAAISRYLKLQSNVVKTLLLLKKISIQTNPSSPKFREIQKSS